MEDMGSMDASASLGIQGAGGRVRKPLTRKEKIQEELKLLEWHKLANDAAIKASLMQNKQLRAEAPHDIPVHTDDDAKWMKKVIQQEHIKPLEVNKEYVLEYERREKENEERLTSQVERHIGTLQKLRGKLEAKHEMKTRTDEYRAWQKTFGTKKQEVMLGKTLAEIEANPAEKENNTQANLSKKRAKPPSELSNVLESLNKLSELEGRITCLESDNVYERMVQQERPSADRRTVMDFKKTRTVRGPEDDPGTGPMAVVYSMRPKQKSWQVDVPGLTRKKAPPPPPRRGNGVPPMRGRGGRDEEEDDEGGGTFALTGIDTGGRNANANPKLDRARKLHDASAGQKQLRTRVQAKMGRTKDIAAGTKKHNEALSELNKRRNQQQIQKRGARGGMTGVMASKGASAGVKSNNRHMNDFQKTKDQFKRRNVVVKRGVNAAATDPRGMRGARNTSKSAPNMRNTDGVNSRRMPNTRGGTGGKSNVTRRTDMPQRRGMGQTNPRQTGRQTGGRAAASAPPGAVGGVGGIRALRNKREQN